MSISIAKSLTASLLAIALSSQAWATGQVYGNYGQGNYQQDPNAPYQGGNNYQGANNYQGSSNCDGDEVVGTGLGAIVGGIIGNQFGRGSGRTAATIGGVILGGIVGNAIAKDACKDKRNDAYYYNNAYYDSFNDPDEGDQYSWNNPYTNNHGYVSAGDSYEDGYQGNSGPCREFTQQVYIDGYPETATGVACRQSDGTWRIVSGQ